MNAEQRAVFQGIVYYYRENQVLCRYQATLKEAVDPALLQQALDAARPLAEYYFLPCGVGKAGGPSGDQHCPLPCAAGQHPAKDP